MKGTEWGEEQGIDQECGGALIFFSRKDILLGKLKK